MVVTFTIFFACFKINSFVVSEPIDMNEENVPKVDGALQRQAFGRK